MRRGRPVKLNQKTLQYQKSKGYAEIVFFGDVHLGSKNCEVEKAQAMLDYCLKHKIYVLGMGDLIECSTKGSIGAGVYDQSTNPQEQFENCTDMLFPLAEAGLLLGLHRGNHEMRTVNDVSIDLIKMMCGILRVPYLGGACWSLFRVGKQNYSCYSIHGKGGSQFPHTKLAKVARVGDSFMADIVAYGHLHQLSTHKAQRQSIDLRSKTIRMQEQSLVITGHYLKYFHSYAQDSGMPPNKTGSPKAKLMADKKDVYVSF